MTAGTFRALRFSKFTGTTERSGAAHFADFRIPFWIDATDGGPETMEDKMESKLRVALAVFLLNAYES
jgi:hypothetical protein